MAGKTTKTTKKPAVKKTRPAVRAPRRAAAIEPRKEKPVFRAWTWITILALAALIGFAVYLNRRQETTNTEATPSTTVTYVFTSEDGLPSSIEVKPLEGETVRIARNADNVWALELPEEAEADQGLAQAAADQVSNLRILNEIDLAPDVLGVDNPAFVITIKFTGGSEHILEVGDTTPTNNGYYVRVDKKKSVIVDLSGLESLLNLVHFPPYLSTPTPTATPLPPTGTPVPPTATSASENPTTPAATSAP